MHRNGTTKVNLMKSVCLLAIRRNVLGALCPSMQAIKLINLLVLWSEIVTYDNVGSYMYVWYRLSICPLFPRCGNRSNWKSIRIDLNWKWICTGTGTSPGLRCTQCQDLTSSMNNHFSSMVLSTYVSSKDLAWTPSISATSSWLTMHPIIINTCEKELGTHMSTTNWPTLLVYATNDMDNRPMSKYCSLAVLVKREYHFSSAFLSLVSGIICQWHWHILALLLYLCWQSLLGFPISLLLHLWLFLFCHFIQHIFHSGHTHLKPARCLCIGRFHIQDGSNLCPNITLVCLPQDVCQPVLTPLHCLNLFDGTPYILEPLDKFLVLSFTMVNHNTAFKRIVEHTPILICISFWSITCPMLTQ